MAIVTGQVSATATTAAFCTVPAGACIVIFTNDSASAGSAYIGVTPAGTTPGLTSSNGIPLPAGQSITFAGYSGSAGASMSVVAASTANVGYLISSDR